jgi:UrcA family protein
MIACDLDISTAYGPVSLLSLIRRRSPAIIPPSWHLDALHDNYTDPLLPHVVVPAGLLTPYQRQMALSTLRGIIMTSTTRAALLAAGAIGIFAAGAAQADQRIIHYKRVDVQTAQGAATMYSHIRMAALNVCEPDNLAVLRSGRQVHACVDATVNDAVQAVDSPALTAIYEATRDRGNLPAGG